MILISLSILLRLVLLLIISASLIVWMWICELLSDMFSWHPVGNMSNAILASIIISAVIGLIDIDAMKLLYKIDKFDFVASMGAFFGVVFHSVEIGLLIAVAISFAKILLQVTRPWIAVLGKVPRTTIYEIYYNILKQQRTLEFLL